MAPRTSVDASVPGLTRAEHARSHPRVLGWVSTTALALGGSNQSLFLLAALFARQGSAAVPVLICGLALSWAQMFGWTELVLMWPNRVGGIAAVCAEAFRPYSAVLANLTGVCYWWGWVPTCGLTAILSASAVHQWCLPGVSVKLLAGGLVALFAVVNICGVRWAARVAVPIALASATLAFLCTLIPVLAGHVDWHRAVSFTLHTPFTGTFGKLTSAMAGLYLVGFAAPAFEAAACHVGETRDPERNVPRAMFASAGMATLYFAVLPIVWLGLFGPHPLEGSLGSVLGPAFGPLFGAGAKAAAIGFMTLNMFHGTLQPLAGAARTLAQLSEDGLLPRALARRARTDAPWVATTLTAVMAIALLSTGDPTWVIAAANLTYLIGVCLPTVAVFLLRRQQPHMARPYRAPRGFLGLGLCAAGVWLLSTVLGFEQFGLPTVIAGLGLAYSGSVLYVYRRWRDRRAAGTPGVPRSLHIKLTGAMVVVMSLDGVGYLLAVTHVPHRIDPSLVAALEDIFVAVALLTITVGLVLPGVIAHAVTQVSCAAERLSRGTVRDLTRAMQALADGDLEQAHAECHAIPVVVYSRDEIGEMATSFNAMQQEISDAARSLDGAREGLRSARAQLTTQNEELERWSAELEERVAVRTAELQRAHDELAALATTDPLSGLPNHRAMVSAIDRELARSRRQHRPLSLLFVDIDHFKALNDSLGHGAGDAALHETGELMVSTLRPTDIVGRWGGEEFLIVLPETEASAALGLAERLRATVAAHVFGQACDARLTCSIGAATCPADGQDRTTLIDHADRAMYAAKRLGRNRVFAAADPAIGAVAKEPAVVGREETSSCGAVEAIALLANARDRATADHMDDVSSLAVGLALELDLSPAQIQQIGVAGRLHDIGKVGVPDAVLRKRGRLTDREWELMRTHPAVGADVLAHIPSLAEVAPVVRGHHERWDGTGYPDALAREDIPVGARILAVADSFGAMTTHRPYRRARPVEWALDELHRCAGSQFDPTVVRALRRLVTRHRMAAAA